MTTTVHRETSALREPRDAAGRATPDVFDDYLGPAIVLEPRAGRARVVVGDRSIDATLALAVPYEPAIDDVVLLASRRGAAYVIGVITGKGKLSLEVPGDVAIRAAGGTLSLTGDNGVRIVGREVELTAKDRLRVIGGEVSELFTSLTRNVAGRVLSQAAEIVSNVSGRRVDTAHSSTLVVEDTATINGQRINLG